MDRFIANGRSIDFYTLPDLKSNMDRFIDLRIVIGTHLVLDLKSNMDRFIAPKRGGGSAVGKVFKIQYG